MTHGFRVHDVVGRTITAVRLNRWSTGYGGWTFDPVFVLDNDAEIRFTVDETESTEYGITPRYIPKPNG